MGAKGHKLGDEVVIYTGTWAGYAAVVRDVFRDMIKLAIKGTDVVITLPKKHVARKES